MKWYYRTFYIKKKNGGMRKIIAPMEEIKKEQRRLYHILSKRGKIHEASACRPGKGIIWNANKHVGKKLMVNLDLKDFFGSITSSKIRKILFYYLPDYNIKDIEYFCEIATYENKLTVGSPCSPIIADMICYNMDKALTELAENNNAVYTRYVDDITFSSDDTYFPYKCMKEIHRIINMYGFKINYSKYRIRRNGRHEVTGLVTNKKVNVPREVLRNFRARLHNLEKEGKGVTPEEYMSLMGYINYFKSINPSKASGFEKTLERIVKVNV
jgi:RNA-directed DNA polymerase